MELRRDLEFSISEYGDYKKGLLTLGESQVIQLENGKTIELLPYLLEMGYSRGVSKKDPRVRRSHRNAIPLLAEAYANHYNNAGIDEHWITEEVEAMMNWQLGQSLGQFFFVKWARETETEKEFPVGFVSAYAKPFQGGTMLWDAELFVSPEYQRYGIGTELTKVLLTTAKASGIDLFEALTYQDENGHPLNMWEKFGTNRSDLVHIYGEIDNMIPRIDSITRRK